MATQLDAEIEKIKNEIESVNNFNAGKKREKVLDMLAKWCCKANSFDKQITQLKTTLEIEKDNNQYYKKQMEKAQVKNNILENENINLLQSQQEMREFIESIPDDLRAELLERFEEQQALPDPTGQDDDAFKKVIKQIENKILNLYSINFNSL